MTKATNTTFNGFINSITEALILLEAARRGYIKMRTKRLILAESTQIESGTTYIVNETTTGIKRWSDGKLWTPSKLRKGFFIYYQNTEQSIYPNYILKQKEDLLVKKVISITAPNNDHFHLVNYYRLSDIKNYKLMFPSQAGFFDLENIKANVGRYKYNITFRNNRHKNSMKSEESESKSVLNIVHTNTLLKETLLKKDLRYLEKSTEDLRQIELLNKEFKSYLILI